MEQREKGLDTAETASLRSSWDSALLPAVFPAPGRPGSSSSTNAAARPPGRRGSLTAAAKAPPTAAEAAQQRAEELQRLEQLIEQRQRGGESPLLPPPAAQPYLSGPQVLALQPGSINLADLGTRLRQQRRAGMGDYPLMGLPAPSPVVSSNNSSSPRQRRPTKPAAPGVAHLGSEDAPSSPVGKGAAPPAASTPAVGSGQPATGGSATQSGKAAAFSSRDSAAPMRWAPEAGADGAASSSQPHKTGCFAGGHAERRVKQQLQVRV
jgi:hypothetical protein